MVKPLPIGAALTTGSTLPTGTVTFLFTDIQALRAARFLSVYPNPGAVAGVYTE